MDFLNQHLDAILSFIAGVITGVCGSLITINIRNTKASTATNGSTIVDQSGANAGRDVVGGNSSTKN